MQSPVMRSAILAFGFAGIVACGAGQDSTSAESVSSSVTAASPIDSNTALAPNGGCHLPPIGATGLDQLAIVNAEWAPVVNGSVPLSVPVLAHGTAVESQVSKEDFPGAHIRYDQNTLIRLDPSDTGLLATGNGPAGEPALELEWEAGSYPDWAWAGEGDRVVALGRWIFDCGHPEPLTPGLCHGTGALCLTDVDCSPGAACEGASFSYRSELHPPHASAVIRQGGGGVLDRDEEAVPVTRADVWVNWDGGGAGDACVVTHKDSLDALLGAPCFPLSSPLALIPPAAGSPPPFYSTDFRFEIPLPQVRGGRKPVLRVLPRPAPMLGGVSIPASFEAVAKLDGAPRYEVTVRMTQPVGGLLPTGFAATLLAGWRQGAENDFAHLRVTVEGVVVRDVLKAPRPGSPAPPPATPRGWKLQANVNGDWQEIGGLDDVGNPTAGPLFPVTASYDVYVPRDGSLRVHADAASTACVDTLFGRTLLSDLLEFGFDPRDPGTLPAAVQLGELCLSDTERDAGAVDAAFAGPRFGARKAPYEIASRGGEGRSCSRTAQACSADADCAFGETCDGAFKLRFRVERVDDEEDDG